MDAVVQERLDRLNDILDVRRQQLLFRLLVAGLIIVFFSASLGIETTLAWATAYGVLQIIERSAFTPFHPKPKVHSMAGYWFALSLIIINPMVFCLLGMLWPFKAGAWGVANAALLLSGAMINAVLTTKSSRPAFIATIVPTAAFVLALPAVAWRVGATAETTVSVAVGGLVLIFTSLRLWHSAHQAHNDELAARAEAEQRRAEAESAVAAKSAFVAVVSHELRTPISAILAGAAELERTLEGAARGNARLIADAGSMMRTLLNDLLDLAKLDAGRMSVESIPYDLREVIADQLRFWRAEARKKGLRLRLTGAAGTPRYVMSDPTRLRQILNNLLSNALKFTTEGSVTVALRCETLESGRLRHDRGAGRAAVQGLRSGRRLHRAHARRDGARPRDQPRTRPDDGRGHCGDEHAAPRLLFFRDPDRRPRRRRRRA
jgi:signal transduction histidine kinase